MIHNLTDMAGVAAVRARHPDAAIIRRTGAGAYVVFDRADEARGHPTGFVIATGTIRENGSVAA